MSNTGGLPAPTREVEALVDLIGPEAALKLIEMFGGTRIYVPARDIERSIMSNAIGEAAAISLAAKHGGNQIMVPVGRHWRILVYYDRGMKHAEIARHVGCSERSIYRVLCDYGVERRDGREIAGGPAA